MRPSETIGEPADNAAVPHRHRHTGWVWVIVLVLLGFAAWHFRPAATSAAGGPGGRGGAAAGRGGRGGRGGAGAAIPVVATPATAGSIPVYLRGLGTVTPANTVTLHSRVDGQITAIHFQEGQTVRKGDLLVEIDPRPYQAALAQAQGNLQRDTALYNDDLIDFNRYRDLYQQKIISQQQLDAQAALVSEYKGAMASDQASIQTAALNVSYCKIAAPITGRIGLRLVDAGNIIHASDAGGLATITEVQPIAVLFTLPQEDLPQVYGELRAGRHPVVAVFDSSNTKLLATGSLLTIDNEIDPTTGTFRLKAMFNNADNALFPNQFVNARMQMGTDNHLTIVPPAAIQRGPQGSYVYVVSKRNTVSARTVTVALTEGNQAGISTGLQSGEQVVVDGADRLQDGSRVNLEPASGSAPAPTAGGNGTRRGGRGGRRGGRGARSGN